MVQIFGPDRTARILNNLPWDVANPHEVFVKDTYNPAAMLTTKITATAPPFFSMPVSSSSSAAAAFTSQTNSAIPASKKICLEELDYTKISLPAHMVVSTQVTKAPAPNDLESVTKTNTKTSNLDSVLNQIAGKKKLNTVEKSSNDWEGFKETDKTLQDELERQAQGKNAYLVKQDFLNRVDQRTFELEKEGRDQERSRRAAESK